MRKSEDYNLYKFSKIKDTLTTVMHAYNALFLVLKNMPGWIYWKNRDGVYLGCNQELAIRAGLSSPEDVIGKTDYDLPWREEAACIQVIDQKVINHGKYIEIEEPVHGPGGRVYTLLTRKSQLIDSNDNVIGMLGISVDITDKKAREDELSEMSDQISRILDRQESIRERYLSVSPDKK